MFIAKLNFKVKNERRRRETGKKKPKSRFIMMSDQELIRQGAEARVYKTELDGRQVIAKQRFSKSYRHPDLDYKLTRGRLNQEARCLKRCRENNIRVPEVILVNKKTATLYIEFITGITLKDWIIANGDQIEQERTLMAMLGKILFRMHGANIIHGDLTTSNMMFDGQSELVIIDFGLGYNSLTVEDKAVDLYVLERAFISTHPNSERLFSKVLEAYSEADLAAAQPVLKRLEDVRQRGRKRDMSG